MALAVQEYALAIDFFVNVLQLDLCLRCGFEGRRDLNLLEAHERGRSFVQQEGWRARWNANELAVHEHDPGPASNLAAEQLRTPVQRPATPFLRCRQS